MKSIDRHAPSHARRAGLRRHPKARGTSLVEALVAFAVVTLSALALLRIQALWTLAGQDAAQQTRVARSLQTGIDTALSPMAIAQVGTTGAAGAASPTTLAWTQTRVAGSAALEWSTTWSGGWERRDGSLRAWTVHGHEYRVSAAALVRAHSGWTAAAAGPGGPSVALLAPSGRPAAWDTGFDAPALEFVDGPPRDRLGVSGAEPGGPAIPDLPSDASPVGPSAACAQPSADPPRASNRRSICEAGHRATRSGAIRWSSELLTDPTSRAELEDWVAGLLSPPTHSPPGGGADPDPRCAFRLEPGVDPHLAWRCLGQAWSASAAAPSVPTSTAETRPGADTWPAGMSDPLGGLPPGLRACRYVNAPDSSSASAVVDRNAAAPATAQAILQHQRVHWLVIQASRECPASTTAHRP